MTKRAAWPAEVRAPAAASPARAHRSAGTCHPGLPGSADTAASDPTSREVQLLRTTKQNKGVRRGRSRRGSNHRCLPSPPAALRPARRWPRTKAWAAPRSLVSPRAARDRSRRSRRGATRDGKTRWLRPSSRLLHPSLRVPAAWPPSAGARGGLGPGSAGSPRGKDCLCLKVTTRARCPGWAWCLPFPGRGGGDGGPPQISGGDRGKAHFPPPPHRPPRNGPLRDPPASGGGGQLLSLLGGGGPSQLLSLFRGGGEGETQWPPSASIPPTSLPEPRFSPAPPGVI